MQYNRLVSTHRSLSSWFFLSVLLISLATVARAQERLTLQQENRAGAVTGLALSADGSKLITANSDGSFRLWNTASKKMERTWTAASALSGNNLAFTPDGKQFLSREASGHRLYDTTSLKEIALHDNTNIACLAPTGRFLALGNTNGLIRIVGLTQGEESRVVHQAAPHPLCMAFSADGKWLAVGSQDQTLRLWSLENAKAQLISPAPKNNLAVVGFTPDNQILYSRSITGEIRLYDVATGTDRTPPEWSDLFHTQSIAAFTPDGSLFATATRSGAVKVWELATGKERLTLPKTKGPIAIAQFSADGKRLLTSPIKSEQIFVWDLESAELLTSFKKGFGATFVRDGKDVLVGQSTGLQLFDAATGKEGSMLEQIPGVRISGICADGKHITTTMFSQTKLWDTVKGQSQLVTGDVTIVAIAPGGKHVAVQTGLAAPRLWNQATGASLFIAPRPAALMVFSPDGKKLAVAMPEGDLLIRNVTDTALPTTLQKSFSVTCLACSANGERLAAGSLTGEVKVWNLSTGKEQAFSGIATTAVVSVALAPDGKSLLAQTQSGRITHWDLETEKPRVTFPAFGKGLYYFPGQVSPISISPDGKVAAAGFPDGTLQFWDALTGAKKATTRGHDAPVTRIVFSPDSKILASAGNDAFVKLWEVDITGSESGSGIKEISHMQSMLLQASPAFSPDSRHLVVGSGSGSIRIWDIAAAKPIADLQKSGNPVARMEFTHDGKILLTGNQNGTASSWDVESGSEQLLSSLPPFGQGPPVMAVDPRGNTVAVGRSDGFFGLWHSATGTPQRLLQKPFQPIQYAKYSPDGKTLALVRLDGTITLWDVPSHQERATLRGHRVRPSSIFFSSDSKTLASFGFQESVRIWDVQKGTQRASYKLANNAAFDADTGLLAMGQPSGIVELWDTTTGKALPFINAEKGAIKNVELGKAGRVLFTRTPLGAVKLWDVTSKKQLAGVAKAAPEIFSSNYQSMAIRTGEIARLWDLTTGKEAPLLTSDEGVLGAILFSPNGQIVASIANGKTRLQEVVTGKHLLTIPAVSLAFSEDGALVAARESERTVTIWDLKTAKKISSIDQGTHNAGSLALSADGKLLFSQTFQGQCVLWNTEDGKERLVLPLKDTARSWLAPDGKSLLTHGKDTVYKLWDTTTGKDLATVQPKPIQPISALAFSRDGSKLAAGTATGIVTVWNPATGEEILSRSWPSGYITAVNFAADGNSLTVRLSSNQARVWNLAENSEASSFMTSANNFALAPSGKVLAMQGKDYSTLQIWDLAGSRELALVKGYYQSLLMFSPDSKLLLGQDQFGSGALRLLDAATGKERVSLNIPRTLNVQSAAFTADSRTLGLCLSNGQVKLLDTATGQERGAFALTMPGGYVQAGYTLEFAPDGKTLAVASRNGLLQLWHTQLGKERLVLKGHLNAVQTLAADTTGRVVTGSFDQTVRVWEGRTGKELAVFRDHKGLVLSVAISRDGKWLASAGADNLVYVRPMPGSKEGMIRCLKGHQGAVWTVVFSPDGRWLATGSSDRTIKLWDLMTGQEAAALQGHTGEVFAVAFTPDSKTLISADGNLLQPTSPGVIKLWDVGTGKELSSSSAHKGAVRCLAISPDGQTLASGGADRQILMWDLESLRTSTSPVSPRGSLLGHALPLSSLAFSADGKKLASAGSDPSMPGEAGEVKMWQTNMLRCEPPLLGHRCGVTCVAFGADGTSLITGSFDETAKLWDMASFWKK